MAFLILGILRELLKRDHREIKSWIFDPRTFKVDHRGYVCSATDLMQQDIPGREITVSSDLKPSIGIGLQCLVQGP